MPWYSILPAHLSGIETWIIRICLILAFIILSPWLIATAFDILWYLTRFLWYYVPVYGGRAQGGTRPRASSLADSTRRRTLSLTGMMSSASTSRDQVREEHNSMSQRHARTMSDESVAEEEDEDKDAG